MKWHKANTPEELEKFYISILPKLRKVARKHGYAIGLHGSLRRDMDLIAVAWTDNFSSKDVLAKALQKSACGLETSTLSWEIKPNGRKAISLPICWSELRLPSSGHIDLSVIGGE
jgi:hypothetical protein